MAWLSSQAFAELAGISERKARLALKRAAVGKQWRGARLIVRTIKGRGGKSGFRYEVRIDSLPLALQEALNGPPKALAVPKKNQALRREVLFHIVSRITKHPKGSAARADEIRAICEHPIVNPDSGRLETLAPDTIRRFVREYERDGLAALGRKARKDRGATRTFVTAKYDAWARGKLDLEAVAGNVRDYIRAQHKNLESVGNIQWKASRHLEKLTRKLGFEPPPGACSIPLHIVKAESAYRRAGEFEKDRKKFQDDMPGIRRTSEWLAPMDIVVGDVHPLDFLLPEVERFQRYAKAICWLDVATRRIWMTIVILPKGEGVRNEHVIDSWIEMSHAWGLAKVVYLDNGSEYNFADFIEDALKLIGRGEERVIIRAKPYNARAKIIEGVFAVLRHYFAKLPGYVGGDRMKSKVANVGKAPVPFNGSHGQFREMIAAVIAQYHCVPQKGELKGRSPFQAYDEAVAAGWSKTAVDPEAFFTAFSTEETRVVTGGAIQYGGRFWTCKELASYLGARVTVLVPKFENWDRLPIKDERGRPLGFAEEDRAYAYLDPAGAKESGRRQKLRLLATRELAASAPTIDPLAETLELARELPKELPAPVGARVTASDEARAIARGVKESPKAKREREEAARDRKNEMLQDLRDEFKTKFDARKVQGS